MSIGQSLEETRRNLRFVPTQNLMEYKQNPEKKAIDGIPLDMLAGLELSRRADFQQEQTAMNAPNPQQMPTVIDAKAQQAMGIQSLVPQGSPQGAPQGAPQMAQGAPAPAPAPAPQGQPPAPQGAPQPAPQQMAQAPAPAGAQMPMQPTQQQPKKLAIGGIVSLGDMQDMQDQGGMQNQGQGNMQNMPNQNIQVMAGGGIVAFNGGGYSDPMGTGASEIMDVSTGEHDGRSVLEHIVGAPPEPEWKRKLKAEQAARAEGTPPPAPSASASDSPPPTHQRCGRPVYPLNEAGDRSAG